MTAPSSPPYPFGDMLALARQSWLTAMATRLAERGYPEYRRSDAVALRLLRRGPAAIGRLGQGAGVTRQAARKIADNLVQRGFATITRDASDSRQLNVSLTPAGEEYARALTEVIAELNREVVVRATPEQLRSTDSVLRAILFDDSTRQRATWLPRPDNDPAQPR
jgi:DNA-binding MarR family transcriptional regulator